MAESAGTTYAEIRIALDKLQGDISKATQMFSKVDTGATRTVQATQSEFNKLGSGVSKSVGDLSKNTIGQFTKMAQGMQKAFMALPIVGLITAIAGVVTKLTSSIGKFINETSDAFFRQQKELKTLNTIIQTTGAEAWTSAAQLNQMAQEISKATGIATNDITEMQSRLLTYTNIIGENFDRAQKAAVDMAAVMKMDVTSAAETLGKALDSPMEGLTALTRQGFRFKGEIKEQIQLMVEQGDVAGAQALILKEVETAYGGVAAAQESVSGNAARLKAVQEELNAELGRTTSAFTNWWTAVKLSIAEARLFELRQSRIAAEAKESEDKIKSYTQSIDELKAAMAEASSGEVAALRERIREFENLISLEREAEAPVLARIEAAKQERALIIGNQETAQAEIRDELRRNDISARRRAQLTEYLEDYNRAIAYIEQEHRAELEAINQRMLAAQRDLDLIRERQRAGERSISQAQREAADVLKVKQLQDLMANAAKKRTEAITQAGVAVANNRITEEEYNKKVQDAYTEEANQLSVIRMNMRALNLETEAGKTAQTKAINDTTKALGNSITLEQKYKDLIAHNAAVEKANAVIFIDNANAIRLVETQRRGNAQEILALEKEIALEKLKQEEYYKNAPELQKQLEESLINMIEVQRSTESEAQKKLSEGEQEYLLLMARREGNLERVRDLEREIAREKLESEDMFKFATEETQQALLEQVDNLRTIRAEMDMEDIMRPMEDALYRQTASVEEIAALEKKRAWDSIASTSAYLNASEDTQLKVQKLFEDTYDIANKKNPWKTLSGFAQQYGGQVSQILNAGMQMYADSVRRETEILKKELETRYKMLQESLEAEKQERLYQAGFIEALTEEQFQRELELAIESGDQQRIFQAHSAHERFLIEDEFAQKQKALEEQTAREKAMLDYKVALAQWQTQLFNAAINLAQSILASFAQLGPIAGIAGAALMTTLGGIQIAAIKANKPQLQSFAYGGIVAGSSFRGDNNLIRANSGEGVFTPEQMQNMAPIDSMPDVNATILINLEGDPIAKVIVDKINRRQYLIEAGSISE